MTAPYDVRVASAARRQLSRLPAGVAAAVVEFITAVLPENPQRQAPVDGTDVILEPAHHDIFE